MKKTTTYLSVLTIFSVLAVPTRGSGAQPGISITILETFDYPGTNNSTVPTEINDRGDVAGSFIDSANFQRGFVRFASGRFSPEIVPPFDVGDATGATDINDIRTVCGFFFEP